MTPSLFPTGAGIEETARVLAYMLDTNIAIHARDGTTAVLDRLAVHAGHIVLSALSLAELERGIFKDPAYGTLRRTRLDVLMKHIPMLPFDTAAAEAYGRIIAAYGWARGRDFDRMIAGHAISADCVLVTANVDDFRDIPLLSIENWARTGRELGTSILIGWPRPCGRGPRLRPD